MNSYIGLVVLICAVAVNADSKCSISIIGDITKPHYVNLQAVVLQPGVRDYKVTIPDIPECTNGVAGVKAITCDADVAPTGRFESFTTLYVHRNGNLEQAGSVLVTVYCF